MKHVISVLVENKFGVLARISGLFSARGFNIDSLAVGETDDPTVSRMTIVVAGDERTLEQVKKQLNKLIDVIKVQDFTGKEYIDRELILVKVSCSPKNRKELIKLIESVGATVANVGPSNVTVEETGDQGKIKGLLELLRPYGIREVVRTGRIAVGTDQELVLDSKKKTKGDK
jgi:acetolactate synthase-1/3 small subunit